ncbi:hypothetical protein PENSPDRAFT_682281 [Peniophora sp. CONT]|nr:hypothetical protein PENSPDRAFT_682281 [Peniophora sp. CONT]
MAPGADDRNLERDDGSSDDGTSERSAHTRKSSSDDEGASEPSGSEYEEEDTEEEGEEGTSDLASSVHDWDEGDDQGVDGEDGEGISDSSRSGYEDSLYEEETTDPTITLITWNSFIAYLARLEFPASFLRQGQYGIPKSVLYLRRVASRNGTARRRLVICAGFEWDLTPDSHNIATLVDAFRYKVPLDGVSTHASVPADKVLPSAWSEDEMGGISIWALFELHWQNKWRLNHILRSSPRAFLDICEKVFVTGFQSDNLQQCDCLDTILAFLDARILTPEGSSLAWIDKEVFGDDFCDICAGLLDHLNVPSLAYCAVRMIDGLVDHCVNVMSTTNQLRPPFSRRVKQLADKLWDKIWASHEQLLDAGVISHLTYGMPAVDVRVTRTFLFKLYHDYAPASFTDPPILLGDHSPDIYLPSCRLILLCWMHSEWMPLVNRPAANHATFNFALSLFGPVHGQLCGLTQADFDQFIEEDIIGRYGAEPFMRRLAQSLEEDEAIQFPKQTATLLNGLAYVIARPEFWSHYVSTGLLDAVTSLVDNPHIPTLSSEDQWRTYKGITNILIGMLLKASIKQAAKPLVQEHNIFAIAARASICFVGTPSSELCDRVILNNIISVYTFIAGGAQARGNERDVDLLEAILQSVKAEWYPTIQSLRRLALRDSSAAEKSEMILEDWLRIGHTLGLQEKAEQRVYAREMKRVVQLCAWIECDFHEKKPPNATRACAGCGEVRYCSRECQHTDWKKGGHKQRCKRLKD